MNQPTILSTDFFVRDTRMVARELLGKVIYRQVDELLYRAVITETEAYHGTDDLACHCSKGKTPRTEIMYKKGGHIYIYLIYGMHLMLNFVCMPEDFPAAVLIRGIKDLSVSRHPLASKTIDVKTDGPGKLTKHLQIEKELNGKFLSAKNGLWVADEHVDLSKYAIQTTPRIGIDYAQEWKNKPWRFVLVK